MSLALPVGAAKNRCWVSLSRALTQDKISNHYSLALQFIDLLLSRHTRELGCCLCLIPIVSYSARPYLRRGLVRCGGHASFATTTLKFSV